MVMITTAIAIMTISAIRTAHLHSFYHCGMTSNICDSYLSIVNRTSWTNVFQSGFKGGQGRWEFEISGKRVPNDRSLVAERPVPQKISVSNVEPWEACHCLIWTIGTADIYLTLKRDTEAENHQSVEKQVLQVCSQCVFELEASVVVWEAVWHVVFLIFGGQVWLHCFVFWLKQYLRVVRLHRCFSQCKIWLMAVPGLWLRPLIPKETWDRICNSCTPWPYHTNFGCNSRPKLSVLRVLKTTHKCWVKSQIINL